MFVLGTLLFKSETFGINSAKFTSAFYIKQFAQKLILQIICELHNNRKGLQMN